MYVYLYATLNFGQLLEHCNMPFCPVSLPYCTLLILSFVTSAYTSTPTSWWGHTSRRPSLLALSYCISCEASAGPFPDLFSSHWWLVLTRLDYGNATVAGILLKRIQFVMKSAARLVFSSSRYKHITPLLHQLHCLKATERIDYKLAVLVYKCREGIAPSYLPDELCQPAHSEARCHLCSASLSSLIVHRKQLSTVGNCSFLVAASCIWNVLPQHVMSAPSVSK